MDKKDEIILQQLDVIRTMTQNSLSRMGSDFWGAPLPSDAPKENAPKPAAPKNVDGAKPGKSAASTGVEEKKEKKRPFPRRKGSRISKRSWTATSALARLSAR